MYHEFNTCAWAPDAKEPLNKQNLLTADDATNKLRLGDSMNVVYIVVKKPMTLRMNSCL